MKRNLEQTSLFDKLDEIASPEKAAAKPPLSAPEPEAEARTNLAAQETADEPRKRPRSRGSKARSLKDQESRAEVLRYYERKKIALGMERKNYSKLIFILGNGKDKWFKAFGHSVIIFDKRIAPVINSNAKPRRDEDFNRTVHSKEGVIAVRSLKQLAVKLLAIGCTLEDDRDGVYVFNLPVKVSVEEYNAYLRESQETVERTNKILMPHILAAALYAKLIFLHRIVANSVGRMSGSAREMVGLEMEREVRMMIRRYLKASRRGLEPMELYADMLSTIDDLDGDLAAITGLNFDADAKIMEMAEKAEEVRKEVKIQIKILKAKEVDREQGDNLK